MTYPTLALGLVVLAAAVRLLAGAVARRRGRTIPAAPTLVAIVGLLALTAVFDNVMLAMGVDDYARAHASGIRIGRAPLEDFSYPLATALLLPGVWELTRRRHHADDQATGRDAVHHAGHGARRAG
jgi:lycopene cyclase domain-containing protein